MLKSIDQPKKYTSICTYNVGKKFKVSTYIFGTFFWRKLTLFVGMPMYIFYGKKIRLRTVESYKTDLKIFRFISFNINIPLA